MRPTCCSPTNEAELVVLMQVCSFHQAADQMSTCVALALEPFFVVSNHFKHRLPIVEDFFRLEVDTDFSLSAF